MCIPRSKFAELANSHADNLFQLAIFAFLLIPIPLCSGWWERPVVTGFHLSSPDQNCSGTVRTVDFRLVTSQSQAIS